MKDINKRLRDIAEKSRQKYLKRTIKTIIHYIKCRAEDGYYTDEVSFRWYNISDQHIKIAIIEELHNRGYNVTLLPNEDGFRVDWSEENER